MFFKSNIKLKLWQLETRLLDVRLPTFAVASLPASDQPTANQSMANV